MSSDLVKFWTRIHLTNFPHRSTTQQVVSEMIAPRQKDNIAQRRKVKIGGQFLKSLKLSASELSSCSNVCSSTRGSVSTTNINGAIYILTKKKTISSLKWCFLPMYLLVIGHMIYLLLLQDLTDTVTRASIIKLAGHSGRTF